MMEPTCFRSCLEISISIKSTSVFCPRKRNTKHIICILVSCCGDREFTFTLRSKWTLPLASCVNMDKMIKFPDLLFPHL